MVRPRKAKYAKPLPKPIDLSELAGEEEEMEEEVEQVFAVEEVMDIRKRKVCCPQSCCWFPRVRPSRCPVVIAIERRRLAHTRRLQSPALIPAPPTSLQGKPPEYLIRWAGYDASHDSWEPYCNVSP